MALKIASLLALIWNSINHRRSFYFITPLPSAILPSPSNRYLSLNHSGGGALP